MAKSKSNAIAPAAIPNGPVLWFRGVPQTRAFADAALQMRDLISAICITPSPNIGTAYDEVAGAERFAYRVLELLKGNEDSQRGAAAALTHWIYITGHDPESTVKEWTPLAPGPLHKHNADDEWYEPAPGSQFFNLAGQPVSVGPELTAYAWGRKPEYRKVGLDLVRAAGKPISAKRFATLRRSVSATA